MNKKQGLKICENCGVVFSQEHCLKRVERRQSFYQEAYITCPLCKKEIVIKN